MFNKVIMLGRIVNDLELKTTPNGIPVLSFSIAVDRRWQAKGEEKKADFFNCVAWRNEAEFISKYWFKGRPILIEGELQTRNYDDKNGIKRYVTEIIVDRATFTGDKKPEGSGGGYRGDAGFPEPPPDYSDRGPAGGYSGNGGGYSGGNDAAPVSSNGNYKADDFKKPSGGSGSSGVDGDGYPF